MEMKKKNQIIMKKVKSFEKKNNTVVIIMKMIEGMAITVVK